MAGGEVGGGGGVGCGGNVPHHKPARNNFSYSLKCTNLMKILGNFIGLDKSGYQVYIFLNSPRKHMLWVLIRSASARRF